MPLLSWPRSGRRRRRGWASCSPTTATTGFLRAKVYRSASSSWPSSSSATSLGSRRARHGAERDEVLSLAGRARGVSLMFSGFMENAWIIGSIVAVVAGVVGFFVVMRGSAFPAHAIPNGAFAGAAGANLIGVNPLIGLGVFSLGAALGIGDVVAARTRRRRDGARAHDDARPRGGVPQPEHGVRAGNLLAALRRDPRASARVNSGRSSASVRCASSRWRALPPLLLTSIAPEIAAARGLRPERMETHLSGVIACADHDDGAGRRRAADLHVDDRTSGGGALLQRPCTASPWRCRWPSRWSPSGARWRVRSRRTGPSDSGSDRLQRRVVHRRAALRRIARRRVTASRRTRRAASRATYP